MTESQFVGAYQAAAATATLTSITLGSIASRVGDVIPVAVLARTRLFGTLRETLRVPIAGSGSSATIHFSATLLFPGLRAGERLTRQSTLPPRASLLAGDGTPLAVGPDRTSPIPDVASEIVGTLGAIPSDQASLYAARGFPPDAKVGLDGLERVFQDHLAGTPGGTLLAGARVLATAK